MHSLTEMMQAGCTTERGVRFWEEKGLLGNVQRTSGGNRQFSDEQLRKAKVIAAAKFAGWELDEIKPMLEKYDHEAYGALMYRLSNQAELAMRLMENLPKIEAQDGTSLRQEYDL